MANKPNREAQLDDLKWGYDHQDRECLVPSEWPKYYATGKYQSPINIIVGCEPSQLSATCCAYSPTSESQLVVQFQDELRLFNDSPANNVKNNNHHHRSHLNSTGEEHRSPSTSSVSSSASSASPQFRRNRFDDDDNEDDCEDEYSGLEDENANNIPSNKRREPKQQVAPIRAYQNTRHCVTNKKIFLGYPRYLSHMSLCNTGHNWQVNFAPEVASNTLLCGPPLGGREYRLAQFHAHWGRDYEHGSEHQINGKGFAAELHFVHWNCSQFSSMEEAAKHQHGLAVLGVLVQAHDGEKHRNKHLDKLIAGLDEVREPNTEVQIQPRLDLKKLFPANRWVYATYEGSLTTPPLSEVVDWVVFLSPIACSKSQIEQFKQIKCHSASGGQSKPLIDNCRPIQPVNRRVVSVWTHH